MGPIPNDIQFPCRTLGARLLGVMRGAGGLPLGPRSAARPSSVIQRAGRCRNRPRIGACPAQARPSSGPSGGAHLGPTRRNGGGAAPAARGSGRTAPRRPRPRATAGCGSAAPAPRSPRRPAGPARRRPWRWGCWRGRRRPPPPGKLKTRPPRQLVPTVFRVLAHGPGLRTARQLHVSPWHANATDNISVFLPVLTR